MAFTPKSSPTRVSTASFAIFFATSKLRKKPYNITQPVGSKQASFTVTYILFGVNGIYHESTITMLF